jgi:hypothetical protein
MYTQFDSWVSNPDETHGPLLSIITWTLGGVAFGFLLLRYSIRHSQKKLWIDDLVLGMSWVSCHASPEAGSSITNSDIGFAFCSTHLEPTQYKPGVWKTRSRQ